MSSASKSRENMTITKVFPAFTDWLKIPSPEVGRATLGRAFLDAQETPVDRKRAELEPNLWGWKAAYQTCFRHSGWDKERRRRAAAMQDAFGPGPAITHFCECGCRSWILKSTTNEYAFRKVPDTCRSPWCKPCYRSRGLMIQDRLAKLLSDEPVRLVTLTLKSDQKPLADRLDRLYRSFRRLRQRKFWQSRVLGGVAFLEVKIGKSSGEWHPHFHLLVQGKYLPLGDLRQEWLACTGDSHVVDVRLVRDRREVLRYVTKYCTKVADLQSGEPGQSDDDEPVMKNGRLIEAMRALKGRRRIVAFGSWKKFKLLRDEPMGDWEVFCHESELRFRADDGDQVAEAILQALAEHREDPYAEFSVSKPP